MSYVEASPEFLKFYHLGEEHCLRRILEGLPLDKGKGGCLLVHSETKSHECWAVARAESRVDTPSRVHMQRSSSMPLND